MTISRGRTTFVRRLSITAALAGACALIVGGTRGTGLRPGDRGEELLEDPGARDDLGHAAVPAPAAPAEPAEPAAPRSRRRPPTPSATSTASCARPARTAAPATCASTTGRARATASWSRCSSPRATARRSPATCGRRSQGPAKRPGIVITNGSVQAPEQLYWFAAQTLAKAGYVVLTSDPQGQGQSDGRGEAPDENEGFPAQSDGRPFFDGTQRRARLLPLHADERLQAAPELRDRHEPRAQAEPPRRRRAERRVQPVLEHDQLVRRSASPGTRSAPPASRSSGRRTRACRAIVAWDNLGHPSTSGGLPVQPTARPTRPATRAAPITKPALGMSADYGLTPSRSPPTPTRSRRARRRSPTPTAGVDTGELVIRGGTHYEFSFIPNPAFGGTLRGMDQVAWYTTAWFDKYVKRDSSADKRLLTTRWHNDAAEAAIDPDNDGNHVLVLLPLAARHQARQRPVRVRGPARRLRRDVGERRLSRAATPTSTSRTRRTGSPKAGDGPPLL